MPFRFITKQRVLLLPFCSVPVLPCHRVFLVSLFHFAFPPLYFPTELLNVFLVCKRLPYKYFDGKRLGRVTDRNLFCVFCEYRQIYALEMFSKSCDVATFALALFVVFQATERKLQI